MSAPFQDDPAFIRPAPGLSIEALLAVKGTQPIRSVEDLTADTFSSDAELEEFLAFTAAERHRNLSVIGRGGNRLLANEAPERARFAANAGAPFAKSAARKITGRGRG